MSDDRGSETLPKEKVDRIIREHEAILVNGQIRNCYIAILNSLERMGIVAKGNIDRLSGDLEYKYSKKVKDYLDDSGYLNLEAYSRAQNSQRESFSLPWPLNQKNASIDVDTGGLTMEWENEGDKPAKERIEINSSTFFEEKDLFGVRFRRVRISDDMIILFKYDSSDTTRSGSLSREIIDKSSLERKLSDEEGITLKEWERTEEANLLERIAESFQQTSP